MITPKASIAAVTFALLLLIAPAAQARPTDQIWIAPQATLTPEGWAQARFVYYCASRPGSTTYVDSAVIETWGPNGEFGTSSYDDLSEPLTCNGRIHTATTVAGADLEPYYFVAGPATVEASLWNDVLGGPADGFGTRISAAVELKAPPPLTRRRRAHS